MARATLESVARHASVSMQTVSNVINAPHRVRPETLARVQAAIEELGYRPNQASRTLRTRRSRLIGARIEPPRDGVNGAVLAQFLQSLTARTQEAGYRIVVFTATDDDHECSLYEQLLDDHDLDAFVLHATHAGDRRTAWLAERRVPFVTFGRPWGLKPMPPSGMAGSMSTARKGPMPRPGTSSSPAISGSPSSAGRKDRKEQRSATTGAAAGPR